MYTQNLSRFFILKCIFHDGSFFYMSQNILPMEYLKFKIDVLSGLQLQKSDIQILIHRCFDTQTGIYLFQQLSTKEQYIESCLLVGDLSDELFLGNTLPNLSVIHYNDISRTEFHSVQASVSNITTDVAKKLEDYESQIRWQKSDSLKNYVIVRFLKISLKHCSYINHKTLIKWLTSNCF